VREYRIGREHRVLMRPEAREPVAHERLERRDRFGPGDGELPRAVAAGQPDLPGPLPFVQVPADFPVDVVLCGWRRPGQVEAAGRGRLTVVGVEVPPATGRIAAVHEYRRRIRASR
jgi:hypothetical protein